MNAKTKWPLIAMAMCFCFCFSVNAQSDSLVLKNNDVIAGEIKSMSNGILIIKTSYSKNDLTIKWSQIKSIFSTTNFMITLQNGKRIVGFVQSVDSNKIVITSADEKVETTLDQMVYLKHVKSKFWSRTYASIDLGLNMTKANNLRQFNVASSFGYLADKWQFDIYYDDIRSKEDDVEETKRTESGLLVKYFLQKDWYLFTSLDFLSNTEQALDLRTTGKVGAGKFLVHTNRAYWGLGAGVSFNKERFANGEENRQSFEGFVGSALDLFDIGDLELSYTIYAYRSFTESGRWRVDFSFDSKYDLPHDLYLKLGLTFNYDNRPAIAGNEIDYVMVFSIGWEFNK